ncbi:MAG: SDR family NAD(P)-dependent oxidoreductase, partial [Algicola sp.]|nr:SDR family NAD(P)-dependent oxidoreductase [Algicola sp.]
MKTVLITGANRGIGLKFVEYYCQHNWQVYATYRDEHHALLDRTTQYENLTLLKVDVSDLASVAKLQHSMTGITLNLLINNAGTYGPSGHSF